MERRPPSRWTPSDEPDDEDDPPRSGRSRSRRPESRRSPPRHPRPQYDDEGDFEDDESEHEAEQDEAPSRRPARPQPRPQRPTRERHVDRPAASQRESPPAARPQRAPAATPRPARPLAAMTPAPRPATSPGPQPAPLRSPASFAEGRERSAAIPTDNPSPPGAVARSVLAVARGVALFLGCLALLSVLGEVQARGFDSNLWWIDLRPCPPPIARALLAVVGTWLVLFSVRPDLPRAVRWVGGIALTILAAAVLQNVAGHYTLVKAGAIRSDGPAPFAVHVAACLGVLLAGLAVRPGFSAGPREALVSALTTLVCLVGFPLAQMHCFGKTDHRRPADAIVVFGCRVNPDGSASRALYDRVKTACELYSEGLAPVLIVSGGPGDGAHHETDAMKSIALASGVAESQIVVDRAGLDTAATVRNTVPELRERSAGTVLAVSHFYHLPRVKLAYRRVGLDVQTVPAKETQRLTRRNQFLARETAALWAQWFQPLTDRPRSR